jgi:hypothetical protein
MNSATSSGIDMTAGTVKRACRFIEKIDPAVVVISGGEPTLHPLFEDIVHAVMKATKHVASIVIATNGLFITDVEKTAIVTRVASCDPVSLVQVTRGKPFYPDDDVIATNEQRLKSIRNAVIVDINDAIAMHGSLFPAGRALVNHRDLAGGGSPTCSNLYLFPRQVAVTDLGDLIRSLEEASPSNFCEPSIDPAGNIHAGECMARCATIGTVDDSLVDLLGRLQHGVPCNRCGLVKNLPPAFKKLLEQK